MYKKCRNQIWQNWIRISKNEVTTFDKIECSKSFIEAAQPNLIQLKSLKCTNEVRYVWVQLFPQLQQTNLKKIEYNYLNKCSDQVWSHSVHKF